MRQARYRFFLLPLFFVLACVDSMRKPIPKSPALSLTRREPRSGSEDHAHRSGTGSVHTSTSNDSGLYDVVGLNAAVYNLKVTAKGFQTYVQSGVVVNISQTFRVDVKLPIGTESQTITVEADALTVQSDSNVVSTLINEQQITDLPTTAAA